MSPNERAAPALDRLQTMLAELDQAIAVLRGEHHDGGHPADSGTSLAESDRAQATLERMRRRRAELLAAVDRVGDGTYGTCLACGKPVPEGRLEARPEAARCLPCQAKHDRRRLTRTAVTSAGCGGPAPGSATPRPTGRTR